MNAFLCNQMKKVEINDRQELKGYLSESNYSSCEYSLANLIIWADVFNTCCFIFNRHVYIYFSLVDELLFPFGKGEITPEELHEVSQIFVSNGCAGRFAHVPPAWKEKYASYCAPFQLVEMDESSSEYVYRTECLAELKGSKLSKKRNLISQFERNHEFYTVDRIKTAEDFRKILSLSEHWRQDHLCDQGVENERRAIATALEHFEELQLEGLMLTAENDLKAYAVFSPVNQNSYTIHFEKALHDCKGASQLITNRTAKELLGKCEYINREQDLGIPGLRQAKQSYIPDHMISDWYLIPPKQK